MAISISSGRAQNNRVPQLAQLGLVRNLHPPETKIEDKTLRVVSLPGLALSSGHTYTWSTSAHRDILELGGECESAAPRIRGGPHAHALSFLWPSSQPHCDCVNIGVASLRALLSFPLHVFFTLSLLLLRPASRVPSSLVLLQFSLLGSSVRLNGPSPLRYIYMY